jgi:hypothetical protein
MLALINEELDLFKIRGKPSALSSTRYVLSLIFSALWIE